MNLTLIAEGLRLIADGIDPGKPTVAPVPVPAPEPEPAPAPEPEPAPTQEPEPAPAPEPVKGSWPPGEAPEAAAPANITPADLHAAYQKLSQKIGQVEATKLVTGKLKEYGLAAVSKASPEQLQAMYQLIAEAS